MKKDWTIGLVILGILIIAIIIGFAVFPKQSVNIPYGNDALIQMTLTFSNEFDKAANIVAYKNNEKIYEGSLSATSSQVGGGGGIDNKIISIGTNNFNLKIVSGIYSKEISINPNNGPYIYISFFGNRTSSGEAFSIQQSKEKLILID